jgi:hypothetical protein
MRCEHCIWLKLGDWRRAFSENFSAYSGSIVMLTLTAPGQDVLPFRRGTRVCEDGPLDAWCRTYERRWSRLHEAAQLHTYRRAGSRANLLGLAWELQQRGAPHVHPVIGTGTPREMRAAQVYRNYLAGNHGAYGFGTAATWAESPRFEHPAQASRYLAGYLTVTDGGRKSLAAAFRSGRMPRRPLYLSNRLTTLTGVTLRNLRRHRHVFMWKQGEASEPLWWGSDERGMWSYVLCSCTLAASRAP